MPDEDGIPDVREIFEETNCDTLKAWAGNIVTRIRALELELKTVDRGSVKGIKLRWKIIGLKCKHLLIGRRYSWLECGRTSDLPRW